MTKKTEDQGSVKVDPGLGTAKVPEFPEFPEPIPEEPKDQSKSEVVVDPEVAGDLIRIPFEVVHIFLPDFEPLTDPEVEKIQLPFSRCLEKWGLGRISRDELVLAFYLAVFVGKRIKKIRGVKPKNEKYAFFGGRSEGDRKNDSMPGSGEKV